MAHRPTRAVAIPLTPVIELLLGAALVTTALVVVFALRIGGVVATLTTEHGIHSGDVAAVPLALLGAGLLFAAFRPPLAR